MHRHLCSKCWRCTSHVASRAASLRRRTLGSLLGLLAAVRAAGNVANFVESEELVVTPAGDLASFVEVRGSIPLLWTQASNDNVLEVLNHTFACSRSAVPCAWVGSCRAGGQGRVRGDDGGPQRGLLTHGPAARQRTPHAPL
jgi:hypothetical protein